MKVVPVAEAKAHFREMLNLAAEELVVVTKKGRPTAVLLSITDEDLEGLILSRSAKAREILDRSWKEIEAGQGIPHDQFWSGANKN
jgi:prevent-host-death family protein